MICLVTCTGGRPEFFSLCVRWVERQTRLPDLWLVGTDVGDAPNGLPAFARHVPLPHQDHEHPVQRAHASLAALLGHVPPNHDAIVFEDDDWYSADYIEIMARGIERLPLVACATEARYHLPARRYTLFREDKPANAGSVGMRNTTIAAYASHLLGPVGGDNRAWTELHGVRVPCRRLAIKGAGTELPGRRGATAKHNRAFVEFREWERDDAAMSVFRRLLGDDAKYYFETFPQCTPLRASS